MSDFEVMREGDASVTVRHVPEGHEYDFGFVGDEGAEWRNLALTACHEKAGPFTAGLHVRAAREFALDHLRRKHAN